MPEASDAAMVDALRQASAYPHDPSAVGGVAWLQTHISHVFLTGERVYKLRKAVDLPFVHFGDRARRNADCVREVRLNRRLAPDVYLGVAPIRGPGPGFEVGALREDPGAVREEADLEHCVVMRRLPEGADALTLLEQHQLKGEQLDAVADVLARFHREQQLDQPAPFSPRRWLDRIARPVIENLEVLRRTSLEALPEGEIRQLEQLHARRLEKLRSHFEQRRSDGRAVDAHGDVHLQHVWFEPGREAPLLIDCIEFSEELRHIDSASEVAFLAMDLRYRGHPELADRFLARYARETDDYGLFAVVDYYVSYRAAVRAKVAALVASDPGMGAEQRKRAAESAARHVSLAQEALAEPPPGGLVLMCGSVGSGKSTVARTLAGETGAVVVSSDRTRKRHAGLSPTARAVAPAGTGLYTSARTERVYAGLLERATPVMESGRLVVLDASYALSRHRSHARALAARRGTEAWLVHVHCSEATALKRLAERESGGRDASDAGPDFLATSLAHFQPPDEWPSKTRVSLQTDGESPWRPQAIALGRALRDSRKTLSGTKSASGNANREGGIMSQVGEWLSDEMEGLRRIRDEVRVQAELGRAELRDQLEDLEKHWHELEGKLKLLRDGAREDAQEVKEATRLLAEQLRKSYQHLRTRL